MVKVIVILLAALLLEAVGVVLLSKGLKCIGQPAHISPGEIGQLVLRGAANRDILLGILFEAVFFGALLYLLSQRDVSLIWPLTSLGFVITALAAKFVLHEEVNGARWAGVALIVLGAMLVSWSEKKKEAPAPASSVGSGPVGSPSDR
jgi:drug/metabolite transporter (DMT)-like permease